MPSGKPLLYGRQELKALLLAGSTAGGCWRPRGLALLLMAVA